MLLNTIFFYFKLTQILISLFLGCSILESLLQIFAPSTTRLSIEAENIAMPNYSPNDYSKRSYFPDKFPWNTRTSLLLFHHISHQSHPDLIKTDRLVLIKHSVDAEKERRESGARKAYTEQQQEQHMERMFIRFYMPNLPLFFKLPHLPDKSLRQSDILSGFIAFLLQILESEETFWFGYRKHCYAILQDKLTFIYTILGDILFWRSDPVKDLLVELEFLAEKAGTFICSSIFVSKKKRRKNFDTGIKSLLEAISVFLNEKLKQCLKSLQLPITAATSKLDILHSPFLIDSLLHDLGDLMNGRFSLSIDEVEDQIKMLVEGLSFIQTVLNDIQVTHVNEVKKSLVKIREVTYEAEYLIKTFVMGRLQTWYLNLRLPDIIMKVELNGKELQETKEIYNVKDMKVEHNFSYETVRNPEVVVESLVIGFDNSKTKILADLIGGSEKLQNICIYGMPGIGKSTMAKKLYVDRAVYDRFDLRVWCVVSQIYNKKKVLIDILMSLANRLGKDIILQEEDKSLGLEIYKCLFGRRYLIIMDDVWYSEIWDDISRYFPDNNNGSRILITCRVKDTAPVNSIFHSPPFLSDIQCCELFLKTVFTKEPCPPELLGIAKRITSKCHGLPLAVVVVAGIMKNLGKDESMWRSVEMDLKSYISNDQSKKYLKILELSYEHLPDHLKHCFLYLGRFCDSEEIPMRKVIPLWIAQGFVHKKEENSLELVAEDYCSDLINRSLLMIAKRKSNGGIKACSIHDLLRDMCLRKGEEEKFLKHIHESTTYERHSHLALHTARIETVVAPHCRSLAGDLWSFGYHVTLMPLLRVIDGLKVESSSSLEKLWTLFHVKYLSFSAHEFPIGLCMLSNLENIHLDAGCRVYVPSSISKMVNLKHVCITPEAVFEKSYDASTTTKLESLSYILIRNEEETGILKCSPQLHKLSCICDGSLFPDLSSLTELESLKVKFTSPLEGELAELNFPSTVKTLSLYGTRLPSEKMKVVGSLPNLHVLKLFRCAFFDEEWKMTYGEFEELRFLKLSDVSLTKWIADSEHLPRLQYLVVEYVRNLQEIPSDLGCIPTLETIEVRYCGNQIMRSAFQIEEEQRKYGNEDLKVIITGFPFLEVGCMRTRNKVMCCHFSSDGKLLASAGHGNKAVLWNLDTLQTDSTPEEHQHLITDVRFRPNSTQFATASFDKSVRLWDAANPSYCLDAYTGHTSHVMSLDFHPRKSDLFCFCDSNNEIHYSNIAPFSSTRISKQGGSAQVRFQPISGHLLAAASDKVVSVFDVETDRQTHYFQGHSGIVSCLSWDLNGNLLASVSENSIRVWSLTTGECIHELSSSGNPFHSCVFHPTYSNILIIGGLQSLELWNIADNMIMSFEAHENIIAALAQSPHTEFVASASHDSYVKLWK